MSKFKVGDRVVRKAEYRAKGSWDGRCRVLRLPNDGDFVVMDVKLSGEIRLKDSVSESIVGWWVPARFDYAYEKIIVECGDED